MKNIVAISLLILLACCEGSDRYQGNWKALDAEDNKFEITFTPTSLSIKDSAGISKEYPYTQNSFVFENSVETYGIQLEDGRGFKIHFPGSDRSRGLILDENGKHIYTLGRNKHVTYREIYSLN